MPILFKMAFRNIREHKAKSLIIGLIICVGTLVIIVGNSMMDASKEGIRKSFIDNYTGDVMIHAKSESKISVFGVQSMGAMESTPEIPEYEKVRALAAATPGVRGVTSMAGGYCSVALEGLEAAEDEEDPNSSYLFLFGVEPETYFEIFHSARMLEGEYLKRGEPGLLIARKRLDLIGKRYGRALGVGDKVLLNGFGAMGIHIREVPIVGVYELTTDGEGADQMAYVDIDTLRALNGMTLGTIEEAVLDESSKALLAGDADLFADDLFAEDAAAVAAGAGGVTLENIASAFADSSAREAATAVDNGAWHGILLRLDDSDRAPAVVAELNARFAEAGLEAQAVGWKEASGPFGLSIDVVRAVFNVAIIVVAVVAIIIIMNTLIVSVIERTGEIGTMRALGAQKAFVWRLFAGETLALTVVFGFIGTVLSLATIAIVNALRIPATNEFLQLLFGGTVLYMRVHPLSIVSTLVMVLSVSLLAHLYPVSVALKVQPVRAMQTE